MFKECVFISLCLLLLSCSKDQSERYSDDIDDAYELIIPSNFPSLSYQYVNNGLKKSRIELGKVLFHDVRLSADNTISCASCHIKEFAFSDYGKAFSIGIDSLVGKRNAPAIQNMAFMTEYFYDGASNNLEMVPIVPIHNEVEMRENLPSIVEKLRSEPMYSSLFEKAFNDREITSTSMLKALAQYMAVMISSNSRYDRYVRGEKGGTLSQIEKTGLQLFQQKCAACHSTDLFTDQSFRNNGLQVNEKLNDLGRYEVTGFDEDKFAFKVSSLRNVELTAPYMHDGRFNTLEEVLAFYTNGIVDSETLDPLLKRKDGRIGIELSSDEQHAIILFLKTLTDHQFIANPQL